MIILLYFSYYEVNYISELIEPKQQIKDCKGNQDLIKQIKNRASQMKELLQKNAKYFQKLPSNLKIQLNKESRPQI